MLCSRAEVGQTIIGNIQLDETHCFRALQEMVLTSPQQMLRRRRSNQAPDQQTGSARPIWYGGNYLLIGMATGLLMGVVGHMSLWLSRLLMPYLVMICSQWRRLYS